MKRKIALLAGLMVVANAATVTGCTNKNDGIIFPDFPSGPLIPPTTYNLTEQLQDLNELEFAAQMPKAKLSDYNFNNTWFYQFTPFSSNQNLARFHSYHRSTFVKVIPFRADKPENQLQCFENPSDQIVTWKTLEAKYDFYDAEYNHLLSDLPINLPFTYSISGDYFFTSNRLDLAHQAYTDLGVSRITNPAQPIKVPPRSLVTYSQSQYLELNRIDGILSFLLGSKSIIALQIENKKTHQKRDLFYTIADLKKKSQTQPEYADFLTNARHFFYQKDQKSTIEMRFSAAFELIRKHIFVTELKEYPLVD